MALKPTIVVTQSFPSCESITFADSTCNYDAETCPNGYGTPNVEKAAIVKTDIILTAPGSDTPVPILMGYLPTADPLVITCLDYDTALADVVPMEDDDEEDEEPCAECPGASDDADQSTACFADGCWTIKYNVYIYTDVEDPDAGYTLAGSVTVREFFTCRISARMVTLGLTLYSTNCSCKGEEVDDKFNRMTNDYGTMQLAAKTSPCNCRCSESYLHSLEKRCTEIEMMCT
jgi:hypothetical protein